MKLWLWSLICEHIIIVNKAHCNAYHKWNEEKSVRAIFASVIFTIVKFYNNIPRKIFLLIIIEEFHYEVFAQFKWIPNLKLRENKGKNPL